MPTQPPSRDPRWLMRWVTLSALLVTLLGSFIAGIVLAYQTKSPIPFTVVLGSLLLAMRPIITFLFSQRRY